MEPLTDMETLMKTAVDDLQLLLNDPTSILNRKEFTIISDSFPDCIQHSEE